MVATYPDFFEMFKECFDYNQKLNWDVRNAVDMGGMFEHCWSFNMPLTWNTQNVTCMCDMFRSCASFNARLDFDTSRVVCLCRMFSECTEFDQRIEFNLHLSDVEDMFLDAVNFKNGSVRPTFTTSLLYPPPVKETLFKCINEVGNFIPAAVQLTKQLQVNYRNLKTLGYGQNESYLPDMPWKEDDATYAKRLETQTEEWRCRKKLKIAQ